MDGFTRIDEYLDRVDRDMIGDAIASATTVEQVIEIQRGCRHWFHVGERECWVCGYVKPADPDFLIDDIPYLGKR